MRKVEKILIIIIAILLFAVIGIGLWLYQVKPQTPKPETILPTVDKFFPVDTGSNNVLSNSTETASGEGAPDVENLINQNFGQGLNRIVDTPAVNFTLETSSTTAKIIYLDKATGHLYAKDLMTGETARLTNYTAPGLFEAHFITATSGPEFLIPEADQLALAVSPSQNQVFVLERVGDSAVGSIIDWTKSKEKRSIFRSPLTEWRVTWPANNLIVLTTKAAANYLGFAYALNPKNGKLTRLLGDLTGLMTLMSPSGEKLLYNNGNRLTLTNLLTNDNLLLGIETLPEKCVWHTNSLLIYCAVPAQLPVTTLPDKYYRGEVVWNDNFWQINAETGEAHLIFQNTNTVEERPGLDVVNLTLNQAANRLFFQNRLDFTVWSLSWEQDS